MITTRHACTGVWQIPEERRNGCNSSITLYAACPAMASVELQRSALFACRLLTALPMFHRQPETLILPNRPIRLSGHNIACIPVPHHVTMLPILAPYIPYPRSHIILLSQHTKSCFCGSALAPWRITHRLRVPTLSLGITGG